MDLNQEILEKYKNYYNPSLARLLKFSGYATIETKGEGVYIIDHLGNKFLDCHGGFGVFAAGHCHPKIIEAVKKQLEMLPLSAKVFLNKPLAELAEMLAKITPGNLQYSFFCNSGAEAVEGALKLARLYTKKTKIISALGAFHGKTMGSLSVSGRELYKKPFEPLIPDFIQVPFADLENLEKAIDEKTAAVILEPIQGEGGIIFPPQNYLSEVRKLCTDKKILLIIDEIQTGLGRTGKMFACEHFQIAPDIMLLGKALGGGVMPIGAFIGTKEVWQPFFEAPLIHTSTFGGSELACIAGLEALKVIQEENLPQNAKEQGNYLLTKLKEIKEKYPQIIAEARGLGLMIGVEMVKEGYAGGVIFEMARQKVIGAYTLNMPKVIRFEPPLIIKKEEIDFALDVFEKSISKVQKQFIKN
ncbi:MAG: aspartate aminotransferase family protein [Armatimonadetes bacterium]|nr:aspartate aminotransferase family protein [Armatimonadota bacterium]